MSAYVLLANPTKLVESGGMLGELLRIYNEIVL